MQKQTEKLNSTEFRIFECKRETSFFDFEHSAGIHSGVQLLLFQAASHSSIMGKLESSLNE
jgi:hypothetical protein